MMGYIVKDGVITELREEPLATSKSKETLFQGALLGDPVGTSDGFLRFELGAPDNDALKGWIFKDDCRPLTDAERQPLNEEGFVQECVNVQLLFNATDEIKPGVPLAPWVVSADFLIARAIFETGIQNLGSKIPGSDGLGPLQVTVAEWKDFTDNGGTLASDARASDRDDPVLQIGGAAFRQHAHGSAMSKLRLDAGKATADDPFIASFLDMFFAHVTNSPAAALAILDAQDANANTPATATIKDVIKGAMTAAEVTGLFQAREKLPGSNTVFFGTEANPATLKAVVDLAESTLKTLLASAFDKIKQDRPDMIPTVTAGGGAPWMAVARQDEGVTQGRDDAKIKSYFLDTDFGAVAANAAVPAWCGAFAAHCMKQSGNPTVAASVPKGAATAINWKTWGADVPSQSDTVPPGAVVVLSPTAASGGHGHVGFFLGFDANKKNVTLLGGNQSNKVGETPFPASRIAAIRWLDVPGTGAAGGAGTPANAVDMSKITLPSSKVKAANRSMAALIINAFAAAGYGQNQQIAALANAIDESGLDASQRTLPEDSVGLFQLRRIVGDGGNHSVAELQDPNFNTQLIIAEAKKVPLFAAAKNLRDAVDAFVRYVEKPKDKAGESAKRFQTATDLLGGGMVRRIVQGVRNMLGM
jgi:uncharacterized protein (TIGR02594 family)